MPELYGRSPDGTNRKLRELYCLAGGANRKLKELYGVSGGVNRKIFSGYDCQAAKGYYDDVLGSHINADGSGDLNVFSTYYQNDPSNYQSNLDFYTYEPISFAQGDTVFRITFRNIEIGYDNPSGNIRLFADGTSIRTLTPLYNISANQPTNFVAISAGTANHFSLRISDRLWAKSSEDDRTRFAWNSGDLWIAGQQIKQIELI